MINFFIAGFLGTLVCEIISSGSFNLINQTQANGFDLIELLERYNSEVFDESMVYVP